MTRYGSSRFLGDFEFLYDDLVEWLVAPVEIQALSKAQRKRLRLDAYDLCVGLGVEGRRLFVEWNCDRPERWLLVALFGDDAQILAGVNELLAETTRRYKAHYCATEDEPLMSRCTLPTRSAWDAVELVSL